MAPPHLGHSVTVSDGSLECDGLYTGQKYAEWKFNSQSKRVKGGEHYRSGNLEAAWCAARLSSSGRTGMLVFGISVTVGLTAGARGGKAALLTCKGGGIGEYGVCPSARSTPGANA